jgi:hypothetical protein
MIERQRFPIPEQPSLEVVERVENEAKRLVGDTCDYSSGYFRIQTKEGSKTVMVHIYNSAHDTRPNPPARYGTRVSIRDNKPVLGQDDIERFPVKKIGIARFHEGNINASLQHGAAVKAPDGGFSDPLERKKLSDAEHMMEALFNVASEADLNEIFGTLKGIRKWRDKVDFRGMTKKEHRAYYMQRLRTK